MGGDVADEAAGEGVAGAGRVDHALERERGEREEAVAGDQRRPVLALLRDDRGPRSPARTSRAALSRFGLPVSWRSSASLSIRQSTVADRLHERLAGDVDPEVHRVERGKARARALGADGSAAGRAGCSPGTGPRSSRERWRELRLEMLEHAQARLERLAEFRSHPYSPRPEEGLAAARRARRRSTSTPRARSTSSSASPKSSPTGPTTRTSSKKDAASAKCTAAPPSMRSRSPNGVLTESKAIDPTTVTDMRAGRLLCRSGAMRSGSRPAERRAMARGHACPPGARPNKLQAMTSFKDLGLSEPVLAALREIGYESPSPIQEQTIPPLLAGRDVIGQAQTGTGKTAAFGLPMVEYIDPRARRGAGARADADARAVHPGHAGAAGLRRDARRRCGRGVRRRADSQPGGAAARRRPHRRRHRRPRARPRLARLAGAARLPLRGARRGRRDARSRLPRGRREDPRRDALGTPDGAVLGDDAAADPGARRPLPLRPAGRSRSRRRR